MRVGEIREVVIRHAQHDGPQETLVRLEMGVCLGEARVDVAVVNGALTGWEIKSGQDRLDRLPRQALLYSKVLDRAIVVADARHIGKVGSHIPEWWGIAGIETTRKPYSVVFIRPPQDNPAIDAFALAQLVWRDEAYQMLRARDLHRGMSRATRWKLWQTLASSLTLDELRQEVRETLRARQEWPGEALRSPSGELCQSGAR